MKFLYLGLLFLLTCAQASSSPKDFTIQKIVELHINSTINPATFDYLKGAIEKECTSNALFLLKINTPGGLVSTTKEILTTIGESPCPFALWITPEGASATSAGAIISSAAHFLFMSPGTNIGAATPISMGKDIESDARKKAINDLNALVRSISKQRGRNPEAFEKMIAEAKSLDHEEALRLKAIDAVVGNFEEIKSFIHQNKIKLKNQETILSFSQNVSFVDYPMPLSLKLLDIFANPTLAYFFFLIGAALLYFELQAPGGFIAGSIGVIFLILAAISFQILPLNLGALLLVLLSFVLFILEIYITSYGILSIAALVCLIMGSAFIFNTDDSLLHVQNSMILSTAFGIGLCIMGIGYILVKDARKKKEKFFEFKPLQGVIIEKRARQGDLFHYLVRIEGEIWKAISEKDLDLDSIVHLKQTEHCDLTLEIIPPLNKGVSNV